MTLSEIRFKRPVSRSIKVSAHYGKKGPWWSWIVDSQGRWIRGKIRGVGMHRGIDFAAPLDTPVYAAWDGEIEFVGWENGIDRKKGFGKFIRQSVKINEENWHFYYGHLDSYKVKAAQRIKKGDLIAHSGNTGRSTGHHLHIELRGPDWQSHPILFERTS